MRMDVSHPMYIFCCGFEGDGRGHLKSPCLFLFTGCNHYSTKIIVNAIHITLA